MPTEPSARWIDGSLWSQESGGLPLYRGFEKREEGALISLSSPLNRQPRDIAIETQKEIDNWFESNLGLRFRERSLFCTGDLDIARDYAGDHGEVRIIAAVSEFTFCWSPCAKDLYEEIVRMFHEDTISKMLPNLGYRSTDLRAAIESGNEIMIVGSHFLATRI